MKIETMIKDVFKKEVEQFNARIPPYSGNVSVSDNKGKHRKERYGFWVLGMIMILVISIFSLKTGLLRSPLIMEWENLTTLIPENFADVFFEFIMALNSSV
jgi:hypothetical protein